MADSCRPRGRSARGREPFLHYRLGRCRHRSKFPTIASASTRSSCFDTGNDSSSCANAAYQDALLGTCKPCIAMWPLIAYALATLSCLGVYCLRWIDARLLHVALDERLKLMSRLIRSMACAGLPPGAENSAPDE